MRLLVAISSRYYRTSNDEIWTTSSYDYDMWLEHQAVFEEIIIVTRVIDTSSVPAHTRRANGPGVTFCVLPEWATWRFPFLYKQMQTKVGRYMQGCDAALLHSPSLEAYLTFQWLRRLGIPYALECRGEQSMTAHYLRQRGVPLARILSSIVRHTHQLHLNHAFGCVYVSQELFKNYTSSSLKAKAVISDLRLPTDFFRPPRQFDQVPSPIEIVNVANYDIAKDHETLLSACAMLGAFGVNWRLHLVGKGKREQVVKELAAELGINDRVVFHGFVSWGPDLFSLLDQMDLFVLSSITEGMPRALIEAMARGLPAVSTRVPGSKELLSQSALAPIGDAEGLARVIAQAVSSSEALTCLAADCNKKAQEFRQEVLRNRKQAFLGELRAYAEEKHLFNPEYKYGSTPLS